MKAKALAKILEASPTAEVIIRRGVLKTGGEDGEVHTFSFHSVGDVRIPTDQLQLKRYRHTKGVRNIIIDLGGEVTF